MAPTKKLEAEDDVPVGYHVVFTPYIRREDGTDLLSSLDFSPWPWQKTKRRHPLAMVERASIQPI